MEIELSESQLKAKKMVGEWINRPSVFDEQPIFRVFGYAGTGKTTIIKSLLKDTGLTAVSCAYTGKAAMVMRKLGMPQARTIHSTIYRPRPPNKDECNELFTRIKALPKGNRTVERERSRLYAELNEARKVSFDLRPSDALGDIDLFVLDECSMVNDDMLADLLTFKIPLLVLGDPGQLPPIDGVGALVNKKPDILLDEIYRHKDHLRLPQGSMNPVIDFATRARNRISIPYGTVGKSSKISQNYFTNEMALQTDQIITGKNTTRKALNERIRRLKGYDEISPYPVVGEKLICLANDRIKQSGGWFVQLFNGMTATVIGVGYALDTVIELTVELDNLDEAGAKEPVKIRALRAHFDSYSDPDALRQVRWWDRRDAQEFDFGYAITVHKAQGSQWDHITLWDDHFLVWSLKDRARWLYTAITRASESIRIVTNESAAHHQRRDEDVN